MQPTRGSQAQRIPAPEPSSAEAWQSSHEVQRTLVLDLGEALLARYGANVSATLESRTSVANSIVEQLRAQGWDFVRKAPMSSPTRTAITAEELNASNDI